MRLSEPRIPALSDDQLDETQRAVVEQAEGGRAPLNIYRTLVNNPEALKRFLPWAAYIFSRANSLQPRQREIVILRIGFLCRSGYEFAQHKAIGLKAGLTADEIEAIKAGPSAPCWSPADRALLSAADDLFREQFVTKDTWSALTEYFDQRQCMDIVFTAAHYVQVSMILNSLGVQVEPGVVVDPDLL